MRIALPEVDDVSIEYACCGSHALSITVGVGDGMWDVKSFVTGTLKALREACPHSPVDGHDPYRDNGPWTCAYCDGSIVPDGPDQEGRQSWIIK